MRTRSILLCSFFFFGCAFTAGAGAGTHGGARGGPPAAGGEGAGGGPAAEPGLGGGRSLADDGWSAQEREFWKMLQEEMDGVAAKATQACGSTITAGYKKESFRGRLTAGGNYGLDSYARSVANGAVHAVIEVCGHGEAFRQGVAAKLHHVEVDWGQVRYALDAGVFHATINTDDEQYSFYLNGMKDFLSKTL